MYMKMEEYNKLEVFNWDKHHRTPGTYRCEKDAHISIFSDAKGCIICVNEVAHGRHHLSVHVEEIELR